MTKRSDLINKQKDHIKLGLAQCSHAERVLFVRMYGPRECQVDNFLFNPDKLAEHHINTIVDKISVAKLTWAAAQVERTVNRHRFAQDSK